MKIVMVLLVGLSLFLAVGCNYDYGKYGKEKSESNSEGWFIFILSGGL